jgi:hypothetical protein
MSLPNCLDKFGNNNLNVLIFPAGTGVSKEIFDSLKYIRWITLFGIDFDENNFSYYQFENIEFGAPFIKDTELTISYLKRIIAEKKIDCIFPAFDSVIVFLKTYEHELGVKIISSPIETCNICFSKKKTYEYLKDIINVPKILDANSIQEFPVFIKPECGYGSRDSFKITNSEELAFYNKTIKNNIICEYLPGDEFTVDCFTSKTHGLIFCQARVRSKTVNGLSVLTKHVDLPDAKRIGEIISSKLNFIGVWFFQLKYDYDGKLSLLEVAPRIPGAACLHRNKGINFPLLSIYEHYDNSIDSVIVNDYNISCYKCVENRFKLSIDYDYVYIDLDDTIIIKNKVNTKIMQYLYYTKNSNKKNILITRNKTPIEKLKQYNICAELFDHIIQVPSNHNKSEYINNTNSVFIDDSHNERVDVYNRKNICVFNCDMIESLMDEKL